MKPKLYKRFGRWNMREGDKITTIWSDWVGEITIANAIDYFRSKANA